MRDTYGKIYNIQNIQILAVDGQLIDIDPSTKMGTSVSINDNTIVVGLPYPDDIEHNFPFMSTYSDIYNRIDIEEANDDKGFVIIWTQNQNDTYKYIDGVGWKEPGEWIHHILSFLCYLLYCDYQGLNPAGNSKFRKLFVIKLINYR